MPYCEQCGGVIEEGDEFCLNCGAKLSPAVVKEAPSTPQPSRSAIASSRSPRSSKTRRVVLTVVAIVIIGVAAFFSYEAYLNFTAPSGGSKSGSTSSSSSSSTSISSSTSSQSVTSMPSATTGTSTCGLTAANVPPLASVVPLLTAFDGMSILYQATASGQSINATDAFNVDYRSTSTIKVSVTETFTEPNRETNSFTAWVLANGTLEALGTGGANLTASVASGLIAGLFVGFYLEAEAGLSLSSFTASSQFHSSGTSNAMIGSTPMTVTNYVANSLPATVNLCGITNTYTAFQLSVGTPPGTGHAIITYFHYAGTSSSTSGPVNVTLQISSINSSQLRVSSSTTSQQRSSTASTSNTTTTSASSSTPTIISASTSSTTCASTSVGNSPLQFAFLLGNYSSISLAFVGNTTVNGQSSITNDTISYNVAYHSSREYKVAATITSNGVTGVETFWLWNNGTLVAVEYQGQNLTSSGAASEYTGLLGFMTVISNPQSLISNFGGYIHLTSTGATTIGATQVQVSNYAPNTVPFTNSCADETYDSFALQVGAPSGVKLEIVTYFSDSWTVSGGVMSGVFRITALTAA